MFCKVALCFCFDFFFETVVLLLSSQHASLGVNPIFLCIVTTFVVTIGF